MPPENDSKRLMILKSLLALVVLLCGAAVVSVATNYASFASEDALATEVTARVAADSAEATARIAGDDKLETKLEKLADLLTEHVRAAESQTARIESDVGHVKDLLERIERRIP